MSRGCARRSATERSWPPRPPAIACDCARGSSTPSASLAWWRTVGHAGRRAGRARGGGTARGAGVVASPGARRSGLRAVRAGRDRAAGGAADCRAGGARGGHVAVGRGRRGDGDALIGFVLGAGADRRVRVRRWSRGGALGRLRAASPHHARDRLPPRARHRPPGRRSRGLDARTAGRPRRRVRPPRAAQVPSGASRASAVATVPTSSSTTTAKEQSCGSIPTTTSRTPCAVAVSGAAGSGPSGRRPRRPCGARRSVAARPRGRGLAATDVRLPDRCLRGLTRSPAAPDRH